MNDIGTVFNRFHPVLSEVPWHVGIIPDGGRRWAKRECVSNLESYCLSMEKLASIVLFLYDFGVQIVSVYFSSSQNFRRHSTEIDAFCKAEAAFCDRYFKEAAKVYEVRVKRIGNSDLTPDYLMNAVSALETATAGHTNRSLNLCIAYNPFEELMSALNKSPDPAQFLDKLWVTAPLDLIIRSGGASLLSNFLLLQAGFARLHVIDKLFNDLSLEDITEALSSFRLVQKIYGE